VFPSSLYILLQSPRLPACANHIPFTTRFRSLLTKWRLSRVYNLQKGSNETGDTSKSRSDDSGTTGDGRGLRSRLASGRGNSGVGAVVGRAVVADDRRGGGDRLGDGARAVSDGQGGGLSDGVGHGAVGDLSRTRAVGGVDIDNLGDDGSTVLVGADSSSGGNDGGDGELHFVGIRLILGELD